LDLRRDLRMPFRAWVELSGPAGRLRAEARDLSEGGLGLALDGAEPPPADADVVSEFALPGITLPLQLDAQVVWSDAASGRAGVRFRDIDPGLADLLANYVAGRL